MSVLAAIFIAVLLFLYWRVVLALAAVAVFALLILGVAAATGALETRSGPFDEGAHVFVVTGPGHGPSSAVT